VTQYLNCINRGHTPVAEKETLTREQQMMEAVYLGLRTADGIDIGKFEQKFKADFYTMFQEPLSELVDQGLLVFSGENVRLLPRGMTLLDAIAGRIFEYLVF
jgi:oxygen-independent coproporphyrinogen-3 oxidase